MASKNKLCDICGKKRETEAILVRGLRQDLTYCKMCLYLMGEKFNKPSKQNKVRHAGN